MGECAGTEGVGSGMALSGDVSGGAMPCISDILRVKSVRKERKESQFRKWYMLTKKKKNYHVLSLLTSMPRQPCDNIDVGRGSAERPRVNVDCFLTAFAPFFPNIGKQCLETLELAQPFIHVQIASQFKSYSVRSFASYIGSGQEAVCQVYRKKSSISLYRYR